MHVRCSSCICFSRYTPTQFVQQTRQFVGARVGWPLQGWSVWRRPLTLQVPSTRPSCTLAMPRTSSTCRSSNPLLSGRQARLCVPLQKFILDRPRTTRRSMASFRVVSQCGIPRLVHGRPILVDLNKLHFDQPRPGSTDIKVTMKGSGNLDLWTHGRRGCTSGLVGCPNRQHVHVRGRLSAGPWKRHSHFCGVSVRWSCTCGTRTWSGNGVGITNMGTPRLRSRLGE